MIVILQASFYHLENGRVLASGVPCRFNTTQYVAGILCQEISVYLTKAHTCISNNKSLPRSTHFCSITSPSCGLLVYCCYIKIMFFPSLLLPFTVMTVMIGGMHTPVVPTFSFHKILRSWHSISCGVLMCS